MGKPDKWGMRKVQLSLTEEQYQKLRKAAYDLDMTINKAMIYLAMKQLE